MNIIKSIIILSAGFFSILFASGVFKLPVSITNTAVQPFYEPTDYKWSQVIKPGNGSFQEKWQEGNWPMALMPVVAFDNDLWMIGHNKSWSSPDGVNWTAHSKTDWGERQGMSYAFYKNKLWMTGGMKSWDDFRNDVWVSSDGKNWRQIVANANWQPRRGHHLIVFKNKLWLIGAELSSGKPDQTPYKFLNDAWSSEDGINWKQECINAQWSPTNAGHIIVFHDKLWRISTSPVKEIWNSSDGINWRLITDKLPWKERLGNGVVAFDNRLWIFGGIDQNDVWYSSDGVQWKQLNEHAPWSTRSTVYSGVFKNRLWIFSGKTGREDSWAGDVWTLERDR